MASLPGAAMKKSSGYGSALSPGEGNKRFRAGGGQRLSRLRQRPAIQPAGAGSVWPAASRRRQPRRRSAHLRNGTAGSPASPRFSKIPPAGRRGLWRRRSAASAGSGACSMIFVTSPPASVHRIRHRLQAARAAAEDQFLPVNHAAAVGGFKQHAVRGGAGNQPRAVHLPDGGDVVGDLLLGRAQLPAAG